MKNKNFPNYQKFDDMNNAYETLIQNVSFKCSTIFAKVQSFTPKLRKKWEKEISILKRLRKSNLLLWKKPTKKQSEKLQN